MSWIKVVARNKALRRVAPLAFVAMAGVGLAACGSGGAAGGTGGHQNSTTTTTTTSGSSGGAGF